MSVTVIIVNWNSGESLKECIERLRAQTIQPALILIVDNNSADNSLDGVSKLADNISILKIDKNIGFAAGNNRALTECNTEFVALLNPDAFPEKNWLERLLETARKHPNVAAFGSRQLREGSTNILDGTGDIYHISGLAWRNHFGMKQREQDLISCEIFSPCAAAALYRRKTLIDVGGFDEDFFCYMEDIDLGFRLRLAGYKSMYVPEAVVYHIGSAATGGQLSDFVVYHGFRNQVWVFIKNMPGILFWLLLPLHLTLNIISVFTFTIHGQANVIFRSKKDAFLDIPAMWRKRLKIQKRRVSSFREVWKSLDKRFFIPVNMHLKKGS